MAQQQRRRKTVAAPAAKAVETVSTAVAEVKAEVKRSVGLTNTVYAKEPATARSVRVRCEEETPENASHWWIAAGLGGQVVPALAITFRPPTEEKSRTVYVYDGDGTGTFKFIKNGGDTSFKHFEVRGAEVE